MIQVSNVDVAAYLPRSDSLFKLIYIEWVWFTHTMNKLCIET